MAGRARRAPGGPLRHPGRGAGRDGQPRDDGPGAGAPGLVAQEKTLVAAERDEARRGAWRGEVAALDPAAFVFVDECGTHIALTPLYAWAPREERARGAVPHRRGQHLPRIAARSAAGGGAAMTLDGATDTAAFTAYVREVLAPTLRPGQIVFLDNLGAHKDDTVRTLIEDAGCTVRSLPPDSPDLPPIALAFSTFTARLRRLGARTRETLEAAIGAALDEITAADARAWFARCGYLLPPPPPAEQPF